MAKQTQQFQYRDRVGVVKQLSTTIQDIYTSPVDGADITELTITLSGGTARSVNISITDGTTESNVIVISVAANSGNGTSNPAIELIKGGSITGISQIPGVESIGTVNILPLPAGWKLRAKQDIGSDCTIILKAKIY